jgi:Icc-related predicted phosphoesterase
VTPPDATPRRENGFDGAPCVFVSDLHGSTERYGKLGSVIEAERPRAVFLGGDLRPNRWGAPFSGGGFVGDFLAPAFRKLRSAMGAGYPRVFLILGNDDDRASESAVFDGEGEGLWSYLHGRWDGVGSFPVLGYSCVPPTPFQLKDWERYDVSRYTDPGSVSPERGIRTVPVDPDDIRFGTIADDLENLATGHEFERAILLFHSPPYGTSLDRAALDGRTVDHVPVDVHVGSIAIQRFIESRQPLVTLHGHIHEAPRITGTWRTTIGRTHCLTAAHDGPELAVVRFDPDDPGSASRELV